MYAGIDFGTSNCSIGKWEGDAPRLVPLENGSTRLPSAIYTSRTHVEIGRIDEDELSLRVSRAAALNRQRAREAGGVRELTAAEIENIERGLMRRELEERAQQKSESESIRSALYADSEMFFGEAAIEHHVEDPLSGYFMKSPKSFLGADLEAPQLELFSEIVTRMLSHIKRTAEREGGEQITSIVLGRPVNFHGNKADGNAQALNLMERAAVSAGFEQIEFLMEPVAASLDYERELTRDTIVLVLDIGGGTTDCSMVEIGPTFRGRSDRQSSVLGYAGNRVGGIDLDIKLAFERIMPLFGRGTSQRSGLPLPNSLFWKPIAVNDVNLQAEFASRQEAASLHTFLRAAVDKEKFARLLTLQQDRLSHRLSRSSEMAKIQLTDSEHVNVSLDYVENGLGTDISRDQLRDAIEKELKLFVSLMKEAETQADVRPDVVYVTGGSARSPVVESWIRTHYPDVEIVVGDAFGSVTSGLTTWAHQIYA
ncbi:molecular chaperone [Allohahella marinimesophila]|uniref:Molecular chaperone n=1 Tax=Allohahella marinimesophila TaxID=1054972 RepID=A0ABP7Q3J8_9GAMM